MSLLGNDKKFFIKLHFFTEKRKNFFTKIKIFFTKVKKISQFFFHKIINKIHKNRTMKKKTWMNPEFYILSYYINNGYISSVLLP